MFHRRMLIIILFIRVLISNFSLSLACRSAIKTIPRARKERAVALKSPVLPTGSHVTRFHARPSKNLRSHRPLTILGESCPDDLFSSKVKSRVCIWDLESLGAKSELETATRQERDYRHAAAARERETGIEQIKPANRQKKDTRARDEAREI